MEANKSLKIFLICLLVVHTFRSLLYVFIVSSVENKIVSIRKLNMIFIYLFLDKVKFEGKYTLNVLVLTRGLY